MRFWMYFFRILMILTIPYSVKSMKYKGEKINIIYIGIMPWAKAMTIGRDIYIKGKRHGPELIHHEYIHVLQWIKEGFMFIPKYLGASLKALYKGKRAYLDNEYEVEAYQEEYKYCREHNINYVDRYINK